MNPKLVKAAARQNTKEDARSILIKAGIASLQSRAAKMPESSDAPCPVTEQDFSAQTKASRQTRYMRLSKWMNFVWSEWAGQREFVPIEALSEIEFIVHERDKVSLATYSEVIK